MPRSVLVSCLLLFATVAPVTTQTVEQNDSAAAAAENAKTLPLITTRTLRFTTDEGTWISLDVSPDGSTLVFELLGDLYTLPSEGGTATRISSGQAYDMQPRFSPGGDRIVFVSDRNGSENLWIADSDGADPRALTTSERQSYMSPTWTPDGRYVIAGKGTQLWLYHVDGGSGVQITGQRAEGAPAPPAHLGPAFGNDPRYLWLNLRGDLGGGFDAETLDSWADPLGPTDEAFHSTARDVSPLQIGTLDRESGRVLVRTHELAGAMRPVPSPDGRWLVYATRWDAREALKLLDLDSREERWLVMDVQRDDSQGGGSRDRDVYPGSAFTPDSRALITSWGGKIWRVEVPSGEITPIPFTADVAQDLGPLAKFDYPIDDSTLVVSQIRGARPSPDGRHIVFAALDRLWTADLPPAEADSAEGTHPTIRGAVRLTSSTDVEHAPVWSPDGRWIAWVTWNDSAGGDVWRTPADGSGAPERLSRSPAFWDKLAYSKDGTRLMAVRGSWMHRMRTLEDFGGHGGAAELEYVWLPAAGGEATRITWVGGGATEEGRNEPHVGPDPERMYVWAGSEGLLSMRWDGTDVRTVVKVQGPSTPGFDGESRPSTPDEVVLSPDGTRALVRANRNVWLVTVPPVGGGGATVSVGGSSMPARRLTQVGGDFVGWSTDGSNAFWSIGRSFYRYELAAADSAERASRARERAEPEAQATPEDSLAAPEEAEPSERTDAEDAYRPARADIEIVALKDKPRGTIALVGARLITMRGDEVIPEGTVVVRDNRIVLVGPTDSVSVPDEAEVVDVSGKTILPGYVDIHAHTWVAWGVHRNQVSQFLAQLAYGVTTQRDPQTSSEDVLAYSDLMEVGQLIGPRLYSTGPGIFSMDAIGSLDEARNVVRRYSEHFNTKTIKQYLAGDRKVRQWVIMAAREQGLTTTTEGGSNFTMNLTLMQDGYPGLEHSLPISPFYRDVVELERFSGITYTPTLIVSYGGPSGRGYFLTRTNVDDEPRLHYFTPHDELDKWRSTQFNRTDQYVFPLHAEQLAKLVEAGGRVGLGSHGEIQGLGTHWELWMIASGGMSSHEALRIATLTSADAIGLAGDIGSLEVGKLADLQVLDENPLQRLESTTSIRYVMKNGRLYEAATLTEVWPRRRPLPTQWWWRVEPPGEVPVGR
jgi:Tol biopolymer transport system component